MSPIRQSVRDLTRRPASAVGTVVVLALGLAFRGLGVLYLLGLAVAPTLKASGGGAAPSRRSSTVSAAATPGAISGRPGSSP